MTIASVSGTVFYPGVKSMQLTGLGTGTGNGISASANGGTGAVLGPVFSDLFIYNCGKWGMDLTTNITFTMDRVETVNNGSGAAGAGGGFHFGGLCTSLSANGCYASGNVGRGWYFDGATYCTVNGGASDANNLGYEIHSCIGVVLNGAGCEATVAGSGLDGTSYKVSGSSVGCTVLGGVSVNNAAVAFWATDTAKHTTFISCTETSPSAGATAGFKADVSTSTYIIAPTNVTANALSGTYSILSDTLSLLRSVNMVGENSFGQIDVTEVGAGFSVAEGSNAKQGTATLVAGTVAVANTSVTSTSRIFLTAQNTGGTPGALRVSARSAGVSFTITSTSSTDTSVVAYEIFEVG